MCEGPRDERQMRGVRWGTKDSQKDPFYSQTRVFYPYDDLPRVQYFAIVCDSCSIVNRDVFGIRLGEIRQSLLIKRRIKWCLSANICIPA